ncbi:DUF5011 domain-containing protein [Aliiglaciecola litoralis]|uniref:Pesticidal crystal protein Cry22Aa Ig-like domain-containing protein n=1 Tax=Aliiglaciecola litoralis TaxID=582857 RepID=A0ABN1LQ05_9ALTE
MKAQYSQNSIRIDRYLLNSFIVLLLLIVIGCGSDNDNPVNDTTAPVISVTGDNPATVDHADTYSDAGATANDDIDGNVSVTSSGSVDTSTVGSYTITYSATDTSGNQSTAIRTVNVVDGTAPDITITGDNPTSVGQNEEYQDQGATAEDAVDGDVAVTTSGTVDSSTLGEYIITYTASDEAGNQATATRTVNVIDVTAPEITVTGNNPATVVQNTEYTDAGATAVDDTDGTVNVTSSGEVDTSTVGEYTITYTAVDVAGNQATAQRTVNVEPPTIRGVAAAGAAIVGTVTVKGSLGVSTSALIEIDGSYNVDVTGLTPPYRIRAEGTVGGKTYRLHSYAEQSDIGNTVNITPFTDLIVANTAQQLAASFFDSDSMSSLDADELAAQESALQNKLQQVFDALGLGTAIDLLRTAFNADHSGLDAALDLVLIGSAEENVVTITNLLDNSTISDDISDPDDNSEVLTVDPDAVTVAVSDTQAIANLFESLAQAFATGLPNPDDIENLFNQDFLENDSGRSEFLTNITTDPQTVGLAFASVSIAELDSSLGTATVSFNVIFEQQVDKESITWFAARNDDLGWQLLGDQRIVDISELGYHCNDYDGTDGVEGGCGINTSIYDNNFDNNGTGGLPIASASVKLIDGSDGTTVKHTLFLGNPENSSAGDLQVYNEGNGSYQGDWRAFGMGLGEIDPSLFVPGDVVEYNLYTQDLDLTNPVAPEVSVGTEVATYTTEIGFEPEIVGRYPIATIETQSAIENFDINDDLLVEWTLVEGTVSDEVLISINDAQNNRIEIWDESFSSDTTSVTFDAAMFESAIEDNPDFDPNSEQLSLLIRIYAEDEVTGQSHSTDYRVNFGNQSLACDYESGWDEGDGEEFGAPINPNSFADFEEVVASCGGSQQFTFADVAGKTFSSDGESATFSDTGAGTFDDPATGQFQDDSGDEPISFEWYIENVGVNTLLVIYSDSTIDSQLPEDFVFRESLALISVNGTMGQSGAEYHFVIYTEQSNYGDMVRESGDDGEIWNSFDILQ